MRQFMYPHGSWVEAYPCGTNRPPSSHEVPPNAAYVSSPPPQDGGSSPQPYVDHPHGQHMSFHHEYHRHDYGGTHHHQVVTPQSETRLVQLYHEGYRDAHRSLPYENHYARPMVSPPMKIRYIRPPNYAPEGNQVYNSHNQLWYKNSQGPGYPPRRYSEDTSLSSYNSQHSNETALWEARKVSFCGESTPTATEADAKLLLDATAAFHRGVPRYDDSEPPCPFADKIRGCEFVSLDLYGSVPDDLFLSMAQMKICHLNEEDRFGNYKHRKLGIVGMACQHCGGLSGFGRHFPSSFQSLLSGSHCVRIVKHMRSECRACPPEIRQLLIQASQQQNQVSFDHGSRKRFVAHVWSRLQSLNGRQLVSAEPPTRPDKSDELDNSARSEKAQLMDNDDIPWESIVERSELVEAKDRHLVPDSTFFAISQMKSFPLGEKDRIGRHRDQPLGFAGKRQNTLTYPAHIFPGMCCVHCGGKAGKPRYGRFFPSCLKTLAKPASCDRIANHLSNECPACPTETKIILHKLQLRELSGSNRYGSRNIFFQRLWNRLHQGGEDNTDSNEARAIAVGSSTEPLDDEDRLDDLTNEQWNLLLNDSMLVSNQDIGLVTDAQLASMAQLAPCRLMSEDRFGWYKDRKLGFGGLACRHCGGRKGAGRYFPNALRTFSQNNYCQIVGNHIARDCPACPDEIRTLLAKMLNADCGKNMRTTCRRSTYVKGSRKSFYERIWGQIHARGNSASQAYCDKSDEEHSIESVKHQHKKRRVHEL